MQRKGRGAYVLFSWRHLIYIKCACNALSPGGNVKLACNVTSKVPWCSMRDWPDGCRNIIRVQDHGAAEGQPQVQLPAPHGSIPQVLPVERALDASLQQGTHKPASSPLCANLSSILHAPLFSWVSRSCQVQELENQ